MIKNLNNLAQFMAYKLKISDLSLTVIITKIYLLILTENTKFN